MKCNIDVYKSFDVAQQFERTPEAGDLEEFFSEEGKYLDGLVEIMKEHAHDGESFKVVYTVFVSTK